MDYIQIIAVFFFGVACGGFVSYIYMMLFVLKKES